MEPIVEKVVIVGASLGGQSAAAELRKQGYRGEIVLISGEDYIPYDRPPLSKKVLTGDWNREKITLKPEQFYSDNDIQLRLGQRVVQVDPKARTVTTEDSEVIGYTKLIIATGGRPRRLDVPGRELHGIHQINSYDDACVIKSELDDTKRVVVVGCGFIGAEAAAALRSHGKDVTVLEVASAPMEHAIGVEAGSAVAEILKSEGVNLHFETTVAAYHGSGRVREVVCNNGERFAADMVVEAVGIVPNVELAEAAGCRVDNGVVVDSHMRTSVPDIFAIGDVARFPSSYANGPKSDQSAERIRVEHWAVAIGHGQTAAKTICGLDEPYDDLPWFWSDQFDVTYNYAGHAPQWDELIWRGDSKTRKFSVFYLLNGRLAAALCVGRAKDFRGARLLLEQGAEIDREFLADPEADLYRHAKALGAPAS